MKTMNNPYLLISLISCLIYSSCTDDLNKTIVVHEELQIHFTNFEIEGQNRGIEVDLFSAEIQGFMNMINETGVIGQCVESDANGKRIIIDSNRWKRLSSSEREFIVFHELGHCFLNRDHTDKTSRNGTCLSMMHSGTTVCENLYNITTREKYLDELFSN